MSVHRIARGFRSTLAHHPHEFHLRPAHHRRLVQSTRIIQPIRIQKYSTDEGTSEMQDLANRLKRLEKFYNATMEDRLQKFKHEFEKGLEKGLATTNDEIKDLRSWIGLIVGLFGVWVMLEGVFYHRYMEERLEKRQREMETRLTTKIASSITQLKLELRLEH